MGTAKSTAASRLPLVSFRLRSEWNGRYFFIQKVLLTVRGIQKTPLFKRSFEVSSLVNNVRTGTQIGLGEIVIKQAPNVSGA